MGNAILKKVMPDVYDDIIRFIKDLPNYWEI